jgi:hypothetical protein
VSVWLKVTPIHSRPNNTDAKAIRNLIVMERYPLLYRLHRQTYLV